MNLSDFDPDVVVDTQNCIMGRVASQIAQRVLDGEHVAVVNAEHAVITGGKDDVLARYRKRQEIGSDQGPYHPRRPDAIMKRAIRGMLPMDSTRGREAFKRVRVYVGNPFDDEEQLTLDDTEIDRLSTIRFLHLEDISEHLGVKITW